MVIYQKIALGATVIGAPAIGGGVYVATTTNQSSAAPSTPALDSSASKPVSDPIVNSSTDTQSTPSVLNTPSVLTPAVPKTKCDEYREYVDRRKSELQHRRSAYLLLTTTTFQDQEDGSCKLLVAVKSGSTSKTYEYSFTQYETILNTRAKYA